MSGSFNRPHYVHRLVTWENTISHKFLDTLCNEIRWQNSVQESWEVYSWKTHRHVIMNDPRAHLFLFVSLSLSLAPPRHMFLSLSLSVSSVSPMFSALCSLSPSLSLLSVCISFLWCPVSVSGSVSASRLFFYIHKCWSIVVCNYFLYLSMFPSFAGNCTNARLEITLFCDACENVIQAHLSPLRQQNLRTKLNVPYSLYERERYSAGHDWLSTWFVGKEKCVPNQRAFLDSSLKWPFSVLFWFWFFLWVHFHHEMYVSYR